MIVITILSVGKTKEPWLEEAIAEYIKRLQPISQIKFTFVKNDKQLLKALEKAPSPICLDPKGLQVDSQTFSKQLIKKLDMEGARLTFVIGGAEGLPKILRERKDNISLSKMTFTHQITRLILVEQIYRAFEISKGTGYHK